MRHTLRFLRRRDMPQSAIFMLLLLGGTRSIPGEGSFYEAPSNCSLRAEEVHTSSALARTHPRNYYYYAVVCLARSLCGACAPSHHRSGRDAPRRSAWRRDFRALPSG